MTDTGTHIILTKEEHRETIREAVEITLAELGIKGSPLQSGRIYRRQMIETIGRVRYDEAVQKGWLIVHKHNPEASNSKVFATRGDWDRFLKRHTNQRPQGK